MPGSVALGKLFFPIFLGISAGEDRLRKGKSRRIFAPNGCAAKKLVVGKIIWTELRRRREWLVTLDEYAAAIPARDEVIFVRIRRDDSRATRGQTINQPSIGCNSKHLDTN